MLCFALLIALPVILMAVFYLSNSKYILEKKSSSYTSDILTELQKNIENTASELDTIFTQVHNNAEIQALLTEISLSVPSGGTVPANAKEEMDGILRDISYSRPDIESIYLLSYYDHTFFSAVPKITSGISGEDLEAIKQNGGDTTWLKCSDNIITYGRLMVSLQNVEPLGYLIINLSEDKLFDIYSNISLYKEGSIFITDRGGSILSHGDKSLLGNHVSQDYMNLILTPSDTSFSLKNIDGQQYYIACQAINNNEWYLFYQISAVDFEHDIITLTQACFVF